MTLLEIVVESTQNDRITENDHKYDEGLELN